MPMYEYECPNGHRTEKFRHMNDEHPRTIECEKCHVGASRVFSPPAVKDDFPEHFNWSFGCVVKNRAHHRRLQRERGVQDWEPRSEGPGTSKLRKEGLL
jgi:putative FmdB family regulatory protein